MVTRYYIFSLREFSYEVLSSHSISLSPRCLGEQKQTALDIPTKHNSQKATPLSTPGKDGNWERKDGNWERKAFPDTQRQTAPKDISPAAPTAPARLLPLIISNTNIFACCASQAPAAANRKEEAPAFHSPSAPEWVELAKFHAKNEMGQLGVFEGLGFCHPSLPPSLRLFLPPSLD